MTLAVKIHRVRMYIPDTLSSINGMALDEETNQLALLRRTIDKRPKQRSLSRSVIEVWNLSCEKSPFFEQAIYEDDDKPTLLEAVGWGRGGRLFSCGLNGGLNEYDLKRKSLKKTFKVASGAAWCLAFNRNKTIVAVGTEEGYISLLEVGNSPGDEVSFLKTLTKWKDRILCLDWWEENGSAPKLVAGSLDAIAIFSLESGRCLEQMRVGKRGTVVWCLKVLPDSTIVSGDSSGATSFWSAKTATLTKSFASHKADVLCVSFGNEGSIYSSGVDPVIAKFRLKADGEPVTVPSLNAHTHDVRALVCTSSNWLLSGGIDSYLIKSTFPPKTIIRYSQHFTRNVSFFEDMVMFQKLNTIELWKMGHNKNLEIALAVAMTLPLEKEPIKLAEIKAKRAIIASALSRNWLTYATFNNLVVLHRTSEKLAKVQLLCEPVAGTIEEMKMNEKDVLTISNGVSLFILKLDLMGVVLEKQIPFKSRIHSHILSNEHLVISLSDCRIKIFSTHSWEEVGAFEVTCLPTVLEVNPFDCNHLWTALSNHKLIHYDLKKMLLVDSFKCKELDEFDSVKGLCFTKQSVIIYNENKVYNFVPGEGVRTVLDSFRHTLKMGTITSRDNELFAVELTPLAIFKQLPAALLKKRYGT